MSTTLDVVKRAYQAWETQDVDTLRSVLHENYKGKGPGFDINGIADAEKMIKEMPADGHAENEQYIEQGDKVIRIWDWVGTKPVEHRMRMAELTVVKDGKVIWNEAFFDTASFPKEMQDMMKEKSRSGS